MRKFLIGSALLLALIAPASAQHQHSGAADGNPVKHRTHATDCTTGITDGALGEICCDQDDGACFVCVPSAGACDTAGEWKRRDDTGAGGGDPVLISGNAVADASGVDLLGSGVIVVTFNGAVSPDTGTWSFVPANLTGTTTWGGGAGQTWAWDVGAIDPTFTFASNALTITNVATVTAPSFTSTGTAAGSVVLTEADPGTSTVTHTVDGDIASSISYKWPVATSGYHKWTVAAGVATATFNATIPLADGGTNQTAWTASRCVQVNAGGTALESAGAACGSGGSGDNIRVEDGDNAGTFTAMTDADFDDSGDINFTRAAGPPDVLTATVRADAVALITDTTGNFVGSITGGAGIAASAAGEGTAVTVDTASGETGFLASGALTCGAATAGKAQVHTTPLQYCDNAATPALQYTAYATSAGAATSISLTSDPGNCTAGNHADGIDGTGAAQCSADDDVPEAGDYSALAGGTGIVNSPIGTVKFDFTDQGADPSLGSDECVFHNEGAGSGGWICEGATLDTFETRFRVTDPTAADRIVTFPNADTSTVQAISCSGTDKVSSLTGSTGLLACTADDDVPEAADYSALTAGRSLTAPSAGTIDADAELYTDTKCINIDPAATTTDWFMYRTDAAITVTGIDCIVDAATSVVLTLRECDANGGTCGATEAAITCAATNTTEAAGIDDAAVDAGDWMRVLRGTVTGSPAQAVLCFTFQVND